MDMNLFKQWAIQQQAQNTEVKDMNASLQTQSEAKPTVGQAINNVLENGDKCMLHPEKISKDRDRTIAKPNTKAGQSLSPNSAVSTQEETEPVNEIRGMYRKIKNIAKSAIERRDKKMREGLPKDTPLVSKGQGTSKVDTPEN